MNYYRLKIVDNDGSASYSQTLQVLFSKTGFMIYPSPVHDRLTVEMLNNNNAGATVQVIDYTGKVVLQQKVTGGKTIINMSGQKAGNYFIKVISGNNAAIQKITKL
jgi:hypothetical protein